MTVQERASAFEATDLLAMPVPPTIDVTGPPEASGFYIPSSINQVRKIFSDLYGGCSPAVDIKSIFTFHFVTARHLYRVSLVKPDSSGYAGHLLCHVLALPEVGKSGGFGSMITLHAGDWSTESLVAAIDAIDDREAMPLHNKDDVRAEGFWFSHLLSITSEMRARVARPIGWWNRRSRALIRTFF